MPMICPQCGLSCSSQRSLAQHTKLHLGNVLFLAMGPRKVWNPAHIEARRLTVDDSDLRLSLRQWGYVIWDRPYRTGRELEEG
jgi:hypothetical protein